MDNLKPSQIVMMASGAVAFLFSFFSFFKVEVFDGDKGFNAWNGDVGTLFLASWPALFGLIVAGLVAAVAFGNVKLPDAPLTFTWEQIYFVLAFAGAIIMIGYLLGGPDADKGFGFWLMLLGSLGLVAGAVMELLDLGGSGSSSSSGYGSYGGGGYPPQGPPPGGPGGYPPAGGPGGYPPQGPPPGGSSF